VAVAAAEVAGEEVVVAEVEVVAVGRGGSLPSLR
jgi:hypothetical protein